MNKALILEILGRILKSWWTLIAGVSIGIATATIALQYMPKTYQAGTTVLVIPPQIPETLMRSTVTDDMSMRLRALREAVLSRNYMEQLIHEIYGTDLTPEEVDGLSSSIGRRIEVSALRIDQRQGGGVFQLSFRDGNPERVAAVVNKLTRLYIDQNVRFRTVQAEGTEDTIRKLMESVEADMKAKEAEIAAYRERHLYETQDHYSANLQLLTSRQGDLSTNLDRQTEIQDDLDLLNTQKDQADWTAMTTTGTDPTLNPRALQLRRLQDELKNLRSKYSDSHPDVVKKQQELDAFLSKPGPAGTEDGEGGAEPSVMTPILTQIAGLEKEQVRLKEEETRIRADIASYTRRIENTPRVAQVLDGMNQEYEGIRTQYTNYREKLENARAAKEIEENQQGERFEIIQEAVVPYRPISPVPMMIYAMGVIGGLFLFVAPLLVRLLLAPLVGSEAVLRDKTETPILISIPRIQTPAYDHEGRRLFMKNLAWSLLSILAGAAVVVAIL